MPLPSFEVRHRHADDLARCQAILRDGSRSFHAASHLLPLRVREPAAALYAFCRAADDAVDLAPDPRRRLAQLRDRLDRAYAGHPFETPVDRAFADVVAAYAIPRAVPDALIEGLAWDTDGRRYETLADLEAYATRVAGTVGVMMTLVMGVRCPRALARACDLGIAMQLTNIARDVGEDARNGRIYLPLAWLRDAGVDPAAFLRRPVLDRGVDTVVRRLLAAAETLYARGATGITDLPRDCRTAIRAAGAIYAEIGRQLLRQGADPVAERVVVPKSRKLWIIATLMLPTTRLPIADTALALPSARGLVDAVRSQSPADALPVTRGFQAKAEWIIMLFDQIERRERAARTRAMLDGVRS